MAANNYENCLAFVWRPENDGQPYHNDANDPGGNTNMGITQNSWNEAVSAGLVSGELKDASLDQLELILRKNYWDTCKCESIVRGVDLVVFNMAMISGPAEAARLLQSVVGIQVDGAIGPITLEATNTRPADELIVALTSRDESFFATLPGAKYFDHGWDRRADDCRELALSMVTNS